MKKFFTLIACALVAGSAFAQETVLVKQVDAGFSRKSNENADEMAPFKSVEFVTDEATKEAMGQQHQARVVKDPADADLSDRLANWCIEVINEEERTPTIDAETGEQKMQWGSPQWDNGTDWDAQFFVSLPDGVYLEAGTEVTFKMRVKAQKASIFNSASQAHLNPGGYKHYDMIGSIAFTTEWVPFEKTWTVSSEQDGTNTIAINLACDGANPNVYYFDDFEWSIPVAKEYEWENIYENDGTDLSTLSVKYFKNYTDAAKSENGAIVVTSLDPEKDYMGQYTDNLGGETVILANDWDTQFLISLPAPLEAGQKFKFSMKYWADEAANTDVQAHYAAPAAGAIEGVDGYEGTYIYHTLISGGVAFTAEPQTLEKTVTVPADAAGMQSICFNLSKLRKSINYYFDDIAVAFEKEDVPTAINSFKAEKAAKTIYNVAGQQIKSLQKGLNIVNGEKVYVK